MSNILDSLLSENLKKEGNCLEHPLSSPNKTQKSTILPHSQDSSPTAFLELLFFGRMGIMEQSGKEFWDTNSILASSPRVL